jgi:hypothetical protein
MNMSNVDPAHADNERIPGDVTPLIARCFEQIQELTGCLRLVQEQLRKQDAEITKLYGWVLKLDLAVTPA